MKALEWSTRNQYNSFNSYKGLTYYENYKQVLAWFNGKGSLPPPIEASLDPVSACNQACYYCNSQRYLRESPLLDGLWDRDYIKDLLITLALWGVKAFCWGGGGEATLNPNLPEMTKFGVDLGMECSIITNGTIMGDDLMDALLLCRWIGISFDAYNPIQYKVIRGRDDFNKVVDNVTRLVRRRNELGAKCDIAIKALVLPENYVDLVKVGRLAKSLGVDDFHVRPVDLERKDYTGRRQDIYMPSVEAIFEGLHTLENNGFRVYTVTHKYNDQFHVKHDFNRCLASPLVAQICTNKKRYVCVDHRNEERFEIEKWGSDQHRELLKSIDPHTECARCTWSEYQKQMVAIQEDTICRNFP